MKYKASVIGIGQIGHEIDRDLTRKFIWSHTKAYSSNPSIELVAISDINSDLRQNFEKEYPQVKAYKNYINMLQENKIQIISICIPTILHLKIVKEIVQQYTSIEAIFIEKPVGGNHQEAVEIENICRKNNIVLASNYMRRWDFKYKHAQEIIKSEDLGKVQTIVAYGATSLLTSASHLVDLILFFGGKVKWIIGELQEDYVRRVSNVEDHGGVAFMKFKEHGHGFLKATSINDENFMFEIDILLEKGRISIVESWDGNDQSDMRIMKFKPRNSDKTGKYKTLRKDNNSVLKSNERMTDAVSDIIKCINSGKIPDSGGENAIEVHQIIESIKLSSGSNQKIIQL